MESRFDHKVVEPKIYRRWERSGFFNPDKLPSRHPASAKASAGKQKPFTIIMPPPNANGALHVGHALFVTLQDLMIRFQRMRGKKTLWLPGADHAGFETQVVFDKKLEKERRNRFQIPRDKLWKEMWKFTQTNRKIMENQLRELGASCDWSRNTFTLDPNIIKTTHDTFIQMYKDGLLYRGERIVNWCVKHQTTLSDLEIKYVEREDPLYYIKYGPLTLATVRPETKFGDTAVAVNPKDKRYKKYIGKEIEFETLIGRTKMKVIADGAVDPEFGTGVIKVTPAHDPVDFEIGQRHGLEVREVIGKDGRLNEKAGHYAGLKVNEARQKVAEDMRKHGLLVKVDPHYKHAVATCYKCGTTLEPLVMPQWFVRTTEWQSAKRKAQKSLRDIAVGAVKSGKIQFIPKRMEKVFFHWMKNLRDWNISRQIVWGIKIPAWYCLGCTDVKFNPKIRSRWFIVRHGETDWNKERRFMGQLEIPLNKRGREQARIIARQLKTEGVDLIISSDLKRCKQTADIIAKHLGLRVVTDKGLRELGGGEWEGLLHQEVVKKLSDIDRGSRMSPEFRLPGGESWKDLEIRVVEAFRRHKISYAYKNIVIVTHGGPIRAILKEVKNLSSEEAINYRSIENTEIFELIISSQKCKCGSDIVEQDTDVLDTWFSSGQWPYATLNYPKGKDYKTFYPTDVMETASDILFFWVARMIMLGIYRTGKIPFHTVYLHGLVRDKDWQKMSKSKGNVIDPLGVAEIYGTDALRMALIVGNMPGSDTVISEDKIRGYRNFTTKIWNASRFVISNYDNQLKTKPKYTRADRENLKKLQETKKQVTSDLEKFRFHHAAETLYHYFWHTFADKIIEEAKPRLSVSAPSSAKASAGKADKAAAQAVLLEILKESLKMLHPFMPFVTEEIWSKLPAKPPHSAPPAPRLRRAGKASRGKKNLLMIERW